MGFGIGAFGEDQGVITDQGLIERKEAEDALALQAKQDEIDLALELADIANDAQLEAADFLAQSIASGNEEWEANWSSGEVDDGL